MKPQLTVFLKQTWPQLLHYLPQPLPAPLNALLPRDLLPDQCGGMLISPAVGKLTCVLFFDDDDESVNASSVTFMQREM